MDREENIPIIEYWKLKISLERSCGGRFSSIHSGNPSTAHSLDWLAVQVHVASFYWCHAIAALLLLSSASFGAMSSPDELFALCIAQRWDDAINLVKKDQASVGLLNTGKRWAVCCWFDVMAISDLIILLPINILPVRTWCHAKDPTFQKFAPLKDFLRHITPRPL